MARWQFVAVETVPATVGFVADGVEVGGDGGDLLRLRAEALQLRMVAVTAGVAGESLLGQQTLTPEGDESLGVQEAGMEGPEAHWRDRRAPDCVEDGDCGA